MIEDLLECHDGTYRSLQGLGLNADSKPDTPKTWNCTDWMLWHKAMVPVIGKQAANDKFIQAFEGQGSFDYHFNFCKYDCDWVNYFRSQGLDMGHLLSNLVCTATDVTEDVTGAAGDLSKGVLNTAGVVKNLVPIALVGLVAGLGYIGYKNYIKGNKKLPKLLG
ncbi:MAG: hypothetical protein AAF843_18770 [Bacteroidota bacterium]